MSQLLEYTENDKKYRVWKVLDGNNKFIYTDEDGHDYTIFLAETINDKYVLFINNNQIAFDKDGNQDQDKNNEKIHAKDLNALTKKNKKLMQENEELKNKLRNVKNSLKS